MIEYGTFHKTESRYPLRFDRFFPHQEAENVWRILTDPVHFSKWYPFATGEMKLKLGGIIFFDDGEGSTYEGIITEFEPPRVFAFREIDDILHIELQSEDQGCRMIFTHTFDDQSISVNTAAGWHRCLDALGMIVDGKPVEWPDNSADLRKAYKDAFDLS
ncbi:SRPBCC family protein [Metabacillus sp. Hm71]|uniref:SRPBCC family protein n=1 Tax=Metabacillus sp. Hm71 TaxID=3450743 RepID=UPI003F421D36